MSDDPKYKCPRCRDGELTLHAPKENGANAKCGKCPWTGRVVRKPAEE